MCALQGSDQTAGLQLKDTRSPPSAASHFNTDLKTELHTWYWRSVDPASFSCSFSDHWGFSKAMQALGLSGKPASQGGDNKCYRIEHWDPEKRDDNGNQIPALNQWYNVAGIEQQFRVRISLIIIIVFFSPFLRGTRYSVLTSRCNKGDKSPLRIRRQHGRRRNLRPFSPQPPGLCQIPLARRQKRCRQKCPAPAAPLFRYPVGLLGARQPKCKEYSLFPDDWHFKRRHESPDCFVSA